MLSTTPYPKHLSLSGEGDARALELNGMSWRAEDGRWRMDAEMTDKYVFVMNGPQEQCRNNHAETINMNKYDEKNVITRHSLLLLLRVY